MRAIKLIACLLVLLSLAGCGETTSEAEALAVELRTGYLSASMITADMTVTADYGERVYDFSFQVVATSDKTSLTLVAPVELQGMVVEVSGEDSIISCDGVVIHTGALTEGGLTPITAIPTILEGLRSAFVQRMTLEEGVLTLYCGDPDVAMGTGQELVLSLRQEGGDLLRGEIFQDGVRKIDCTVDSISWR